MIAHQRSGVTVPSAYSKNKKTHGIVYNRPIAPVNGILKLWTSILTNIGRPWAEEKGILSDTSDGFKRHKKINDNLSTRVMLYEDAKMSKNTSTRTAYSDFKGAFGGMNYRILFKTMRELGFPECYINTCEQLYKVFGTYYMTPHGNTPFKPIHRGTLQGDTLSPFIFTIFMEPLLRSLSVSNRGYKPLTQSQTSAGTCMSYDDYGYADDIGITTSTLENLQTKIKKLHHFSKYTAG
jgi:hypothetical protein